MAALTAAARVAPNSVQAQPQTVKRDGSALQSSEQKRDPAQSKQWLQFLGSQGIRPALAVGLPDSPEERAADRLADAVMRSNVLPAQTPTNAVASCPACAAKKLGLSKREEECPNCAAKMATTLRRSPSAQAGAAGSLAPRSVHQALSQSGSPLPIRVRSYFEPRFGTALDHVRIHTGLAAAQSAAEVGAHAYAVGKNIVFAAGRFAPDSDRGRHLIAHELAHVVLEGGAPVLRREPDEAPPLTRSQEITQSRSSPGMITGQARPLTLSLWNFGIDEFTLKPEHTAVLRELGHLVSAHGTRTLSIRATGFADETGPEQHNLQLSRRRAQAVSNVLSPLAGRISISAFGESNPAAENDNVEGRSRNRRVDLRMSLPPPPIPGPTPLPPPQPHTNTDPGDQPPQPIPTPRPPPPDTTRPPERNDPSFCEEHPILCGLPILPALPFLGPLVCLVAPELCAAAVCVVLPELCLGGGGGGPPGTTDPPERRPPEDDDHHDGPQVTFVPDVAASNSPARMPDRIGLRDPVTIAAVVQNPPPPTQPITISISSPHSAAGMATINGAATADITGTTTLSILGSRMTEAAVGAHLQLQAGWQSNVVGSSNSFAVSSITQNWSASLESAEAAQYGCAVYAQMDWRSDSGNLRDLDECYYVEAVSVDVERGGLQGMGTGGVNDPANAEPSDFGPTFDQHGTPYRWITRPGYSRLNQLFRIYDARAASGWVASPRSGFTIERIVERDARNPRCWQLTVRKKGAAVSAYGLSTEAGSGDIQHTFHGMNCAAPPPPHRDPPPPPPHDDPPPQPQHVDPPPTPQAEPECDRAELSRRVDACIDEAREGAIECTQDVVLGPLSGWGGVLGGLDYYDCLDGVRTRLLQCDQEAKRDTHCPDTRTADSSSPSPAVAAEDERLRRQSRA